MASLSLASLTVPAAGSSRRPMPWTTPVKKFTVPRCALHQRRTQLNLSRITFQDRLDDRRRDITRLSPQASSEEETYLTDLQVPRSWVSPAIAAQEAEWLKRALHQWLDDEFCPEPSNEEISKRCAKVYYYCLLEEQLDVGDILMQMVRDLETFSFKESFHGSFSSANAAIDLITRRMREKDSSAN